MKAVRLQQPVSWVGPKGSEQLRDVGARINPQGPGRCLVHLNQIVNVRALVYSKYSRQVGLWAWYFQTPNLAGASEKHLPFLSSLL